MLISNRREVVGMSSSRTMAVDPARKFESKQKGKSSRRFRLVTCRRCQARVQAAPNGLPVWHNRPVKPGENKSPRCRY